MQDVLGLDVAMNDVSYVCDCCHANVNVADVLVPRPADDSNHPWAKVPNLTDQATASRFWTSEGEPGRAYL